MIGYVKGGNDMNIQEVLRVENKGKQFQDDISEIIWKVVSTVTWNDYPLTLLCDGTNILENHSLNEVIDMEFMEVIDWHKVPVDSKVLVSDDYKTWFHRHFAKYENDKVLVWIGGGTSFTTEETTLWKYVKLYEEDDK